MFISIHLLLRWALAGVLSTLSMDVGSTLTSKTGFTKGLPPRIMGRWFALLARGGIGNRTITEVSAVPRELPIALFTHYLIGTTLTVVFCAALATARIEPSPAFAFALALGFGVFTNLLPWLWMFPSMGFGVFGRSAPPEWMLLRSSFVNHIFFGLGLAASTNWLGVLRP